MSIIMYPLTSIYIYIYIYIAKVYNYFPIIPCSEISKQRFKYRETFTRGGIPGVDVIEDIKQMLRCLRKNMYSDTRLFVSFTWQSTLLTLLSLVASINRKHADVSQGGRGAYSCNYNIARNIAVFSQKILDFLASIVTTYPLIGDFLCAHK